MEKQWGNDSFAFLIDEGFSGLSNDYGAFVLSMGMAEKGSVDVGIKVENPGGHSSVPPKHTGSQSQSFTYQSHDGNAECLSRNHVQDYLSSGRSPFPTHPRPQRTILEVLELHGRPRTIFPQRSKEASQEPKEMAKAGNSSCCRE